MSLEVSSSRVYADMNSRTLHLISRIVASILTSLSSAVRYSRGDERAADWGVEKLGVEKLLWNDLRDGRSAGIASEGNIRRLQGGPKVNMSDSFFYKILFVDGRCMSLAKVNGQFYRQYIGVSSSRICN